MRARRLTSLALMTALSSLTACGSFLETKQPISTTYVLAPPKVTPRAQPIAADLAVGLPRVAPGLEGQRITVLRGREMNFYTGAQWGAEVSRLTQSMMVRTLSRQRTFAHVAPEDVRIDSDFLLDLEVTEFQAEYSGDDAPLVRVALVGRLVRVDDREPLDAAIVEATAQAEQNRLASVVAAFEQATQQAALQLTERIAASAEAALAETQ